MSDIEKLSCNHPAGQTIFLVGIDDNHPELASLGMRCPDCKSRFAIETPTIEGVRQLSDSILGDALSFLRKGRACVIKRTMWLGENQPTNAAEEKQHMDLLGRLIDQHESMAACGKSIVAWGDADILTVSVGLFESGNKPKNNKGEDMSWEEFELFICEAAVSLLQDIMATLSELFDADVHLGYEILSYQLNGSHKPLYEGLLWEPKAFTDRVVRV